MIVWLVLAAVFAIGNWWAVATARKPIEYVCKPATLAALIGVALALDPRNSTARWWFVVALAFSLLGDVFLMLPSDQFVFGLASFLVGHVAYIVGLNVAGGSAAALAVGTAIAVIVTVTVARPILAAVWRDAEPALRGPVVIYMLAITAMVASALATGRPLAIGGAALFYASDATIARNRFVRPLSWAPVFIMVTYHLGQAGLVLSLR